MVDTRDLKSLGNYFRIGSSPISGTIFYLILSRSPNARFIFDLCYNFAQKQGQNSHKSLKNKDKFSKKLKKREPK